MQTLFIRMVVSDYISRDDGAEYNWPENALAHGVQSSLTMAADEIARGQHSAAIKVIVEGLNGSPLLRSVLAVSVSPLLTSEGNVVAFPQLS